MIDPPVRKLVWQGRIVQREDKQSDGEVHEIIHVPYEQEIIVSHTLSLAGETTSKRIVLVDLQEQISQLHIPGTAAYCMVDNTGSISYFQLQ